MVHFFENTWFVWWAVAIVLVLRWMHVVSPQEVAGDEEELWFADIEPEILNVSEPLATSAS